MKKLISIVTLFLITISLSEARITDGKVKITLSQQAIKLNVDPGFHLNSEAPAKLIGSSDKKEILPVKKEKSEFIFSLKDLSTPEFALEYYVCDDKNTTCEQHIENYQIENNSLVLKSTASEKKEKLPAEASGKIVFNSHHFITDNLTAAKAMAAKEKKLLFVDFSAPWCPACLRLETEVFGEKLFQSKIKNLIKVSLNKDLDTNKEFYEKYKVAVIPTMIIMNANGSEIYRTIDFRETQPLVADLIRAVKNYKKTKTYEEHLALANSGDKDSIKHLALRAYEMYNTKEALFWFQKLNEESLFWAAAEITGLEKQNSTNLIEPYQKYIAKYPESFDSIVWRIELVKLLQPDTIAELSNESKALLQENILLIKKSMEDKKFQKKLFDETAQGLFTSFETEELYARLVDSYQLLREKKLEESALLKLQETILKHPLTAGKTGEVLTAIDYMKQAKLNTEIEKWFIKLMDKNPTSDLYPRKLARFYIKEKEYKKALPVAEKAVKLSGRYLFWSYVLLAQVQKELNLKAESHITATKALDLPEAKDASNKEFVDQLKNILL